MSPTPDDMAARIQQGMQTLSEMVQRRATVTFGPGCEEWETFVVEGMRACVVGAQRERAHDSEDFICVRVTFDFSGMDKYNLPFEDRSYYDADGNPTLTAREAGHFKERDIFSINVLDWSNLFTPAPGLVDTLIRLHAESGSDLHYLAWVEEAAARDMGVSDTPGTLDTPAASVPTP